MYNDIRNLLSRNGWSIRRQRNHSVWACPCGKHLTTLSKTASDYRAIKNKLCELRKLGCPSLIRDLPPPCRGKLSPQPQIIGSIETVESSTTYCCVICKAVTTKRASYAIAPNKRACRHHHGVAKARMQ